MRIAKPLEIEEKEKDILNELKDVFKESLDEFLVSYRKSLEYLDSIVLPLVIASKNNRSFSPFAEIIEKHICFLANQKMAKKGYDLLPLSYSSDLTFENDNFIVHIDIKTANIEKNEVDYKKTIAMGINQISHSAYMSLNRKPLPVPYCVYPAIPQIYKNGKLALSYGLLFLYPSYSDLMSEFREEYLEIFEIFEKKVEDQILPIIAEEHKIPVENVRDQLRTSEEKKKFEKGEDKCKKIDIIVENLIRGVLINIQTEELVDKLEITEEENKKITNFKKELGALKKLLAEKVNSVNIILIAIPNGLLKSKYLGVPGKGLRLQSGKTNLESARFYYDEAYFEFLEEKKDEEEPKCFRVQFIHLEKDSIEKLKKYFPESLYEEMEKFLDS